MVNKREKMISSLIKIFYSKFRTNLIILASITILVFIFLIMTIFNFIEKTENLKTLIMCSFIFIVMIVLTVIEMNPFFRDIKLIQTKKFKMIIGKVVKYRKVVHAGDPTTYSYYPIIRDINKDWVEVEVESENTELNKVYYCIYLPNTKLAICEEVLSFKERTKYKC